MRSRLYRVNEFLTTQATLTLTAILLDLQTTVVDLGRASCYLDTSILAGARTTKLSQRCAKAGVDFPGTNRLGHFTGSLLVYYVRGVRSLACASLAMGPQGCGVGSPSLILAVQLSSMLHPTKSRYPGHQYKYALRITTSSHQHR